MSAVTAPSRLGPARSEADNWRERSARLYEDLRRPARAMLRRAFGSAFGDDEIEDVYGNAWLGTLRALERRHTGLTDEEVRRYVLTAVAHHASKELRRRGRKPTSPLEFAERVPDAGYQPDERVAGLEDRGIARDLLATLPPRRRAVMLLRYGWGLDPSQVCGLVAGLSPRAYRKEITRGVDELTEKLSRVERGEWCGDREPILKAFAAGLADADQERQARSHLAHCRPCAGFVQRLSGHLHDLGASFALPAAANSLIGGRLSLGQRLGDLADRARELLVAPFTRGGDGATVSQLASASGGARGAGAAGSGILAKVAGFGTAGKVAAICLGGSLAATACLSVGVVAGRLAPSPAPVRDLEQAPAATPAQAMPPSSPIVAESGDASAKEALGDDTASSADEPVSVESAPSAERQFGLVPDGSATGAESTVPGSDTGSGGSKNEVAQAQFGP